jgi:hypothetical protein
MDIQSDSTMVKSPGNQPGRKVEVSKDIPSNPLERMLGADAYSEFPQSITMSFETYPKRMDALSNALGNKDTVKG